MEKPAIFPNRRHAKAVPGKEDRTEPGRCCGDRFGGIKENNENKYKDE